MAEHRCTPADPRGPLDRNRSVAVRVRAGERGSRKCRARHAAGCSTLKARPRTDGPRACWKGKAEGGAEPPRTQILDAGSIPASLRGAMRVRVPPGGRDPNGGPMAGCTRVRSTSVDWWYRPHASSSGNSVTARRSLASARRNGNGRHVKRRNREAACSPAHLGGQSRAVLAGRGSGRQLVVCCHPSGFRAWTEEARAGAVRLRPSQRACSSTVRTPHYQRRLRGGPRPSSGPPTSQRYGGRKWGRLRCGFRPGL